MQVNLVQALTIFVPLWHVIENSFVNGLVDPAQQGPFARSIASIAAQIGLPLWFVELRHAATHEDLPSLQVLRDAARKVSDRREDTCRLTPMLLIRLVNRRWTGSTSATGSLRCTLL